MKAEDHRQITAWLYFGAIAIIIQILLGGITRLSGSGLSITEWKPPLGSIPPLNELEWQESFNKYKQIAQFRLVHPHFQLQDYKSIFFWEWLHRNWARFLGFAFLLPLIYFIVTRKISRKLLPALSILFLLGVLQGLIGWIMVKSGLNDTSTKVDHIRLAIHFIAAIILLCYTLWFAYSLSLRNIRMRHRPRYAKLNLSIILLLSIQMIYGAFMAGSNAAFAAITWPDINGYFIPPESLNSSSIASMLSNNPIMIQLVHRNLAYIIALLVVVLYVRSSDWNINKKLSRIRLAPLLLVFFQCALGSFTLLHSMHPAYKAFALIHQFTGILLLISLLTTLFLNLKED